jgi:thiamine transporter
MRGGELLMAGGERRRGAEMHRPATRILAEGGISIALAWILSLVKIYRMPQGGEISLVMVPLVIFALLRGPLPGFIAGLTFGLLHFLQTSYAVHPLQVLLDYPLAYGAAGLAGFAAGRLESPPMVVLGVLASCLGRFTFHVISGIIFIGFYLKDVPGNPQLYSTIYNGAYMVPDALLCIAVIMLLLPSLKRIKGEKST